MFNHSLLQLDTYCLILSHYTGNSFRKKFCLLVFWVIPGWDISTGGTWRYGVDNKQYFYSFTSTFSCKHSDSTSKLCLPPSYKKFQKRYHMCIHRVVFLATLGVCCYLFCSSFNSLCHLLLRTLVPEKWEENSLKHPYAAGASSEMELHHPQYTPVSQRHCALSKLL